MTRRFLNGETWQDKLLSTCTESIGAGWEPPELKHLSRERKRKKHSISLVAASERERAQTRVRAFWGSDCQHGKQD